EVAEVEEEVLKRAGRPDEPARRGPAVVKRSVLTSAREAAAEAAAPASAEPSSEESTRIADEAEMVAQAQAPEPAQLEDFYDDIEIGAAADAEAAATTDEFVPAKVLPPRRLTQNIVRRGGPPPQSPAAGAPAAP